MVGLPPYTHAHTFTKRYCEIACTPNVTINVAAADAHTLSKATDHYAWANNDSRVVGLFIYRLVTTTLSPHT